MKRINIAAKALRASQYRQRIIKAKKGRGSYARRRESLIIEFSAPNPKAI